MATLTIRNLDDRVRDALKDRAQANGRSTEAEVRVLIERAVSEPSLGDASPRTAPRRRFADIEPIEIDHPESAQEVLDYLRGNR